VDLLAASHGVYRFKIDLTGAIEAVAGFLVDDIDRSRITRSQIAICQSEDHLGGVLCVSASVLLLGIGEARATRLLKFGKLL